MKEIPDLSYWYFNPAFGQDSRGYQEPISDPIPLTVTPAPPKQVEIDGAADVARYPESLRRIANDEDVLRRHQPWSPPGGTLLVVLFLLPPVIALLWLSTGRAGLQPATAI